MAKPKGPQKPQSIRLTDEDRQLLRQCSELLNLKGLKESQVFRVILRRFVEQEQQAA